MKCNNVEIGEKPTIEQLTIRIWQKKMDISSFKMYERYEANGWTSIDGTSIVDLDQTIAGINSVKDYKREPGDINKEYELLRRTKEWKDYVERVRQYYDNECQECHKKSHLEVHHIPYNISKRVKNPVPGLLPWEYDYKEVTLLCKDCHKKAHKEEGYSEHTRVNRFIK